MVHKENIAGQLRLIFGKGAEYLHFLHAFLYAAYSSPSKPMKRMAGHFFIFKAFYLEPALLSLNGRGHKERPRTLASHSFKQLM